MMIRVDLRRLENEAAALEQKGGEAGKIVLYGSSFFGVWGYERNREQMGGATVCRGFGGSTGA